MYQFGLSNSGDLALWRRIGNDNDKNNDSVKLWSADTGRGEVVEGSVVVFHGDSILNVYNNQDDFYEDDDEDNIDARWGSSNAASDDAQLIVTNNGEAMILSATQGVLWTSGSAVCGRILVSGGRLYRGQHLCSSNDALFRLEMGYDGDLYVRYRNVKIWSAGTGGALGGDHAVMRSSRGASLIYIILFYASYFSSTHSLTHLYIMVRIVRGSQYIMYYN